MKKDDLTGQRFGRWTAIEYRNTGHNYAMWLCKCECGTEKLVRACHLKSGATKSCGCLSREIAAESLRKTSSKGANEYVWHENYIEGFDYKGNSFLIDKEDYETVSKYRWTLNSNKYWENSIINQDKKIRLHVYLMGEKEGFLIDHHDRNRSNNRRSNLVWATYYQNSINRSLNPKNTSTISGVYQRKDNQRWVADISHLRKRMFLGSFKDKEDAIKARLEAELKYFGKDFAPQRHLFEQYGINNMMAQSAF